MWNDAWMQRLAGHARSIGIALFAASITGMSGAGASGSLAGAVTPGTYTADALAGVAATSAAGRTPAEFGVSHSGAATYRIPLWTPPGVGEVGLDLALVYASRSGSGSVGVGWSIAGLSTITRCNRTWAQDGARGQRHQHPRRSLLPRRPATQARERYGRHGRCRLCHRDRDVLADRRERRRGQRPCLVHGDDEKRVDLRVRRHHRFACLRRNVDHHSCLGAVACPRPGRRPAPAMPSTWHTSTRRSPARTRTARIESRRLPTRPPQRARDRSIASTSPIPFVLRATFPRVTSPATWYANRTSSTRSRSRSLAQRRRSRRTSLATKQHRSRDDCDWPACRSVLLRRACSPPRSPTRTAQRLATDGRYRGGRLDREGARVRSNRTAMASWTCCIPSMRAAAG